MRKEAFFRMERADAEALLARVPVVHFASTTPEGEPVLRAVHGVVVDGWLAFHGSPVGEKALSVGRTAVLSAEETVASIPSYFVDPELACPATTLYRSAQVHGTLEAVSDGAFKAVVLTALMQKFQPEGGYRPIRVEDPRYTKAVLGIGVVRVSLERLDGKAKLAQNRTPAERTRVLECLWRRGADGDCAAIEAIREANPGTPVPGVFAAPEGLSLHAALGARDVADVQRLLATTYWSLGVDAAFVARTHLRASAWVGARDASGRVVGSVRAISDEAKRAWVYDMVVAPEHQHKGLGARLMTLLLDHPAVRGTQSVLLQTRDAEGFYARLGFVPEAERPPPYPRVTMVRR